MTTFLLVRHGAVGALDRYLAGRAPGELLNDDGIAQARRLAERFAGVALDAVYSSPLERARDTAAAFATCAPAPVELADDLLEIDVGEWTGRSFDDLRDDPRWSSFNTSRSTTRIPGGELMLEAQARAVAFLQHIVERLPHGRVVIVSHSDIIRAVIAYHLGVPLDLVQRLEISPASVSVLEIGTHAPKLWCMNATDFDPRNYLRGM
jgi:probable phosphoglycerate mutase